MSPVSDTVSKSVNPLFPLTSQLAAICSNTKRDFKVFICYSELLDARPKYCFRTFRISSLLQLRIGMKFFDTLQRQKHIAALFSVRALLTWTQIKTTSHSYPIKTKLKTFEEILNERIKKLLPKISAYENEFIRHRVRIKHQH